MPCRPETERGHRCEDDLVNSCTAKMDDQPFPNVLKVSPLCDLFTLVIRGRGSHLSLLITFILIFQPLLAQHKQESIPVGCVPSAAVTVGGGVSAQGGGVSQHALRQTSPSL